MGTINGLEQKTEIDKTHTIRSKLIDIEKFKESDQRNYFQKCFDWYCKKVLHMPREAKVGHYEAPGIILSRGPGYSR